MNTLRIQRALPKLPARSLLPLHTPLPTPTATRPWCAAIASAATPFSHCPSAVRRASTFSSFSSSPTATSSLSSAPSYSASASSASSAPPRVPAPIPFVPDVPTFLTVIGRNMKQHTAKFPTWEALFSLTSVQLKKLGIEPARDRRYLLLWCQRFRDRRFGIGGDFCYVRNGVAELRVVESFPDPANPLLVRKKVVNVPYTEVEGEGEGAEGAEGAEGSEEAEKAEKAAPPVETDSAPLGPPAEIRGYKAVGARSVAGPYALPVKGGEFARVTITEGMWEHRRGKKLDGGERRRKEVRFKRRALERRAARERLGL